VPGSNLTYRFRADEYGTSWWHSHLSAQYTAGVLGAVIIYGPSDYVNYDEDLGVIIISDWYLDYYTTLVEGTVSHVAPGQPYRPFTNSNLVGGVGRFTYEDITNGRSCTTVPYSSWKVEPGKTYRARLVNTGSVGFETISIDNHTMMIIANDFVPVQPYQADFVKLAVGQRTDIIFTATGKSGDVFWIRAWNSPECADTSAPDGRGILAYADADLSTEPTSIGLPVPPNPRCSNDDLSLAIPVFPMTSVAEPDVTLTIIIAPSQHVDSDTGRGPIM
jgi:FtsP/CotA-like multicopper oxidase with cupredoxin domain